jgi:hypothetical protein
MSAWRPLISTTEQFKPAGRHGVREERIGTTENAENAEAIQFSEFVSAFSAFSVVRFKFNRDDALTVSTAQLLT